MTRTSPPGLSQMTVPQGLTDDRSAAGLTAAATSWNAGKAYTGAIDPVALALLQAKLPRRLSDSVVTGAGPAYQYGVPNVTLIGTSMLTGDQGTGIARLSAEQRGPLVGQVLLPERSHRSLYGISQTGGFPQTQNNGSQVGAVNNTILLGSHINWEQTLGYSRMGSYSNYTQTVPGGTSVWAQHPRATRPTRRRVARPADRGNGNEQQPSLPGSKLGPTARSRTSAITRTGSIRHRASCFAGQAHDSRRRRLQLYPAEHRQQS